MSLRIAVLLGGPGSERAVSLRSGRAVAQALREGGHAIEEIVIDSAEFVLPDSIDIAFNAIHGTFGEDGTLQTELERRGVPYTGDAPEPNRIAFDKILSKEIFLKAGVTTPRSETIAAGGRPSLTLPLVVKAPREGSSVGVYICKTEPELESALKKVVDYSQEILIEEFIAGEELTVGILGDLALPIILIIPKDGIYDFTNKYPWLNPGGAAEHYCPAPLAPELTRKIQALALAAHRSLGLKVYSRVDILLTAEGNPYVLEVNTIPGMTESSLLPEAAAKAGIGMTALCERIIELSLNRIREVDA